MDKPQIKHKFVIKKASDHQLHVYTSSDNILVRLVNRFSGFGDVLYPSGYAAFLVNRCYDIDEVKEYLESTEV